MTQDFNSLRQLAMNMLSLLTVVQDYADTLPKKEEEDHTPDRNFDEYDYQHFVFLAEACEALNQRLWAVINATRRRDARGSLWAVAALKKWRDPHAEYHEQDPWELVNELLFQNDESNRVYEAWQLFLQDLSELDHTGQ
jgi:hypothetical protein